MKKVTALLMLLCITLSTQAQLLWKISGKNLAQPSYILGTHHLAPISILDSIAGFKQAQEETQQVYGEVVMSEMMKPENLQKVQRSQILPPDTTLASLLTEAEYDSVAVAVKNLIGADLKMFNQVKPAALSAQIGVIMAMRCVDGFNPQQQLDGWIQQQAIQQGKAVCGLETLEFQMNVLYGMQSLERQADLLYCNVTNLDYLEMQTREMTEAYMAQNLDGLADALEMKLNNSCDSKPEEVDALIYDRNIDWATRMPAIMKAAPTLFVVGGGHLPGEQGVLHLLQAQGYTVEAVK